MLKTALLNPGFVLTQILTNKDGTWAKVVYLLQMLLPLGFLPISTKKASRWLLCAPILINLLTYYVYQYDLGFQYHFGIAPFLVYAALQNLADMNVSARRSLLALSAAACFCLYLTMVYPSVSSYWQRYNNGKATYERMEEIMELIAYYRDQGAPQDQQMLIALLRGQVPEGWVGEISAAERRTLALRCVNTLRDGASISQRRHWAEEAEHAMSLFASTSPSYLILQSLDGVNP